MTFEQLDIQKKDSDKKKQDIEQEKTEQFWLEKQVLRETSDLLHSLAVKISQEFGIDITQAKELIRGDTSDDLDALKWNLYNGKKINTIDLKNAIWEARKAIESLSKKKRESLKKSLDAERYAPEKYEYSINKRFISPDVLFRVKNPQNIKDQVIGAGLWLIDSTEAVILFTYALGKWILFTPYHLYLLITGQARYEGWRRI